MAVSAGSTVTAADYNNAKAEVDAWLTALNLSSRITSATVTAGVTLCRADLFNKLLTDYSVANTNHTTGCSTNYGTNNASNRASDRTNRSSVYSRHNNYYQSGGNGYAIS